MRLLANIAAPAARHTARPVTAAVDHAMTDLRDDLRATALAWRAARRPAVVVDVVAVRGSAPREAGARMLVAADATRGSVGGGQLEWRAMAAARARLDAAGAWDETVVLGASLGQCCGGVVTLRYTPLAAIDFARWPLPAPRFVLEMHGAGHVGRAVVAAVAALPCRVRWIDERADAFAGEGAAAGGDAPSGAVADVSGASPARVERIATDDAVAEVAAMARGAHVVVATHRHDLDFAIVHAVLARGDAAFCGLVGSATKRARFVSRLADRGVDAGDRLVCPVGLPGIVGKEPAVVAVAVVAQLLSTSGPRPGPTTKHPGDDR